MADAQQGPEQVPEQGAILGSGEWRRSQDSFNPPEPIPVETAMSMSLEPAPAGGADNNATVQQPTPPTNFEG